MANENDEVKGPKTKPLRKTSAVPLRKETVRVTLKATPAGASGAPRPPAPAPPKPPSVATTPLETSPIDEEPKEAAVAAAPTKANDGVDLPDVTSSVPLRQETMRVTLKSDNSGAPMAPAPSAGAAAATPAPTVPLGSSSPAAPTTPQPAPTVPLGSGAPTTPQPAAPAPTVPLGGGNATVPLATQPLATQPLATQPLGGTGSSQPLPKATVELQQTQQLTAPLGGPSQMPTIQTAWEEEVTRGQGVIKALAIVAFVVALAALGTQLMHSRHWLKEHFRDDWAVLAKPDKVNLSDKKAASEYITTKK